MTYTGSLVGGGIPIEITYWDRTGTSSTTIVIDNWDRLTIGPILTYILKTESEDVLLTEDALYITTG